MGKELGGRKEREEEVEKEPLAADNIHLKTELKQIKALIGKGELEEAIDILLNVAPEPFEDRVFHLQGNFHDFEQDRHNGVLSAENERVQRNKIRVAALAICTDMMKQELNESPSQEIQEEASLRHPVESQVPEPSASPSSKVYLSYAWKDVPQEGAGAVVDQFYNALINEPFELLRDKMNTQYGGLISQFMDDLSRGNLILVLISHAYLRSEYCMYELHEIARRCQWEKDQFTQRILPIRVESVPFDDPDFWDDYYGYWGEKQGKWERLVQKRAGQISEAQSSRYHRIKSIHQQVGTLGAWLEDINASTIPLLSENDFALIKQTIHERIKA